MWAAMSCTAAPRMEEIMENQSLIHREANCLSRFDRLPVKSEMLKIIAVLAAVSVVEAFDLGLIGQTVLVLKQIWNLGPAETGLLATCSTIGVVATLRSTLDPTMRLLQIEADKIGKKVTAVDGLAAGAYQALIDGHPEQHDQLIAETVMKLAENVDCILLAQGSMARMEAKLNEMVSIPVYASPQLCLDAIQAEYDR